MGLWVTDHDVVEGLSAQLNGFADPCLFVTPPQFSAPFVPVLAPAFGNRLMVDTGLEADDKVDLILRKRSELLLSKVLPVGQ